MPARPPNRVRRWCQTALALGVASVLTVTLGSGTAAGTQLGTTSNEIKVLDMVNSSRAAQGVSGLSLSDRLSRMARRHSRRMARDRQIFHHSCLTCSFPSGSWKLLGENVGTAPSLRRVHRMMMRSSSHRSILLNGGFDRVGIGVVRKGGSFWVTEIFYA